MARLHAHPCKVKPPVSIEPCEDKEVSVLFVVLMHQQMENPSHELKWGWLWLHVVVDITTFKLLGNCSYDNIAICDTLQPDSGGSSAWLHGNNKEIKSYWLPRPAGNATHLHVLCVLLVLCVVCVLVVWGLLVCSEMCGVLVVGLCVGGLECWCVSVCVIWSWFVGMGMSGWLVVWWCQSHCWHALLLG